MSDLSRYKNGFLKAEKDCRELEEKLQAEWEKVEQLGAKLAEEVDHRGRLLTIATLLYNDLLDYQDESNRELSDEFKIAQEMFNSFDNIKEEWERDFLKSLEEKEAQGE